MVVVVVVVCRITSIHNRKAWCKVCLKPLIFEKRNKNHKCNTHIHFLKVTEANFSVLQNLLRQFEMCSYMQQMLSLEIIFYKLVSLMCPEEEEREENGITHTHTYA